MLSLQEVEVVAVAVVLEYAVVEGVVIQFGDSGRTCCGDGLDSSFRVKGEALDCCACAVFLCCLVAVKVVVKVPCIFLPLCAERANPTIPVGLDPDG
jgi:hypothetical protein